MKTVSKVIFTSIIGAGLLASCQASDSTANQAKEQVKEGAKTIAKKASGKVDWAYTGKTGADNWGDLSEKFSTCKTGKLQSPFNITADITADLPDLGLNYTSVPMKIVNNGHTIQADLPGSGALIVDGKRYNLLQFHFHAGSEYAINGKKYPLEVHLVHASDAGELAVVGVMFEEGEANAELANIWANMPKTKGTNVVDGKMVNVNNLLPANKRYYRFMGSLTTPPCTEGVNWHMMTTPITASKQQIEAFKAIFPMNARPLQDENNRLVVIDR